MALALTACGSSPSAPIAPRTALIPKPLRPGFCGTGGTHRLCRRLLTETLDEIIEDYKTVAPNVTITPTMTPPGTLLDQIQAGAGCDLFLSAGASQMDTLEQDGGVLEGSCLDLLENKVALAVPEGNPKGIESFDQLSELLKSGDVTLAIGNSDVPVGQYTQKIFSYYGLNEGGHLQLPDLRFQREGGHHPGQRRRSGLRHHLRHRCFFRGTYHHGRCHRRKCAVR